MAVGTFSFPNWSIKYESKSVATIYQVIFLPCVRVMDLRKQNIMYDTMNNLQKNYYIPWYETIFL